VMAMVPNNMFSVLLFLEKPRSKFHLHQNLCQLKCSLFTHMVVWERQKMAQAGLESWILTKHLNCLFSHCQDWSWALVI